jgi:hypothetical protein
MNDKQSVDPRHYLWAAVGVGCVVAPFVVPAVYFPFAVFMAVLGGLSGVTSIRAIVAAHQSDDG